jgi:serine/threonine protein kinase
MGICEKLRYLSQAMEGLSFVHTRTPCILHGDIKPANILIANDNKVRSYCFGTTLPIP